jgi:phage N-6-adenine-methyltransferase
MTEQSKSNEWETEPALFRLLSAEFHIETDVCANEQNHLCGRWIGRGGVHPDALDPEIRWTEPGGCCFMNPPFNREQGTFVAEAARRSVEHRHTVIALVPTYTDTGWWNQHMLQAIEIRDLVGRIKFLFGGVEIGPARFPVSIGIFVPWHRVAAHPLRCSWRWRDEAAEFANAKPRHIWPTPLLDATQGNP